MLSYEGFIHSQRNHAGSLCRPVINLYALKCKLTHSLIDIDCRKYLIQHFENRMRKSHQLKFGVHFRIFRELNLTRTVSLRPLLSSACFKSNLSVVCCCPSVAY